MFLYSNSIVWVNVNVCYASSVSQFTKLSNVSKPLCSSKVTNRNVCNTSSFIKLIKPLNVIKTVSSNNTTGSNACKISSVSQLVKPSTFSKHVLSINVHNIRNVNSISKLVHLMLLNLSVPVMQKFCHL